MLNSYFTYFSDGCGQIWNVKWFWIKAILVLLQLQCIHMDDRLQSYCLLMKTKYLCLKFHLSSCFKSPMCSVQEGDNMPHLTDLILVPKLVISFKYLGVRDSGFILVCFSQCLPFLSLPQLVFERRICLWSHTCDKVSAWCFPFTLHCYAQASRRLSLRRGEITHKEVT